MKLGSERNMSPCFSATPGDYHRFVSTVLPELTLKNAYSMSGGYVNVLEVKTGETLRKTYFDEISEESFTQVFNTNAVASYWLTFAFLPLLERWKESPKSDKFALQTVITSSMNGWAKVGLPTITYPRRADGPPRPGTVL